MKTLVFFSSFFLYSGFYVIIAILFSLGLTDTRVFTIPLRLIGAFFMIAMYFKSYDKEVNNDLTIWSFLVFWSYYFIKVYVHVESGYTLMRTGLEYISYSVIYGIIPFLGFCSLDLSKYSKSILSGLVISGVALGILSLYLYFEFFFSGIGRLSEVKYIDENVYTITPLALSYAGALTFALCLYILLFKLKVRYLSKWLLYLGLLLSTYMLLIGASRGSILALLGSLLIIIIGFKRKYIALFVVFISGVVFVFLASQYGSFIFERMGATFGEKGFGEREELWGQAWGEFLEYPFLGGRIEIGHYPHNFILEILMSTGIFGTLLLLFGFGQLFGKFKNIFKTLLNDQNIWIGILLFQGVIQHSFSGAIYTAIMLYIPLGLVSSLYVSLKKGKDISLN